MTELKDQTAEQAETQEEQPKGWPAWAWPVALGLLGLAVVLVFKLLASAAEGSYSGALPGGGVVALPGARGLGSVKAGSAAPEFTLKSLDGRPVTLEDQRGQVVIVNFWATWCPPCRAEMPDIEQVYREYKGRGVTVLAVNIQEAEEPVAKFVNKFGLTFPILMDVNGEVTQKYGIAGLPSTFFIDREGRVAEVQVGALTKSAISKKVEQLLK